LNRSGCEQNGICARPRRWLQDVVIARNAESVGSCKICVRRPGVPRYAVVHGLVCRGPIGVRNHSGAGSASRRGANRTELAWHDRQHVIEGVARCGCISLTGREGEDFDSVQTTCRSRPIVGNLEILERSDARTEARVYTRGESLLVGVSQIALTVVVRVECPDPGLRGRVVHHAVLLDAHHSHFSLDLFAFLTGREIGVGKPTDALIGIEDGLFFIRLTGVNGRSPCAARGMPRRLAGRSPIRDRRRNAATICHFHPQNPGMGQEGAISPLTSKLVITGGLPLPVRNSGAISNSAASCAYMANRFTGNPCGTKPGLCEKVERLATTPVLMRRPFPTCIRGAVHPARLCGSSRQPVDPHRERAGRPPARSLRLLRRSCPATIRPERS